MGRVYLRTASRAVLLAAVSLLCTLIGGTSPGCTAASAPETRRADATVRPHPWHTQARVAFNQHAIEARRAAFAEPPAASPDDALFGSPVAILELVLAATPVNAVIYPTELYYYFDFSLHTLRVAGNLRFTEAREGLLHIGYFDREDPSRAMAATFGPAQGVEVRRRDVEGGGAVVDVAFGPLRRAFSIPARRAGDPSTTLAPDERFVSWILDESAVELDLIFNSNHGAFYYLLRPSWPGVSHLATMRTPAGHEVSIDPVSRFVFLHERSTKRRVLIGVSRREVVENSPFDGPFDQVPPDLDLKAMLEAAYPYVMLRGGIDRHGNFEELEGQRVAIAPYTQYASLSELLNLIDDEIDPGSDAPARWLPLVTEDKRTFHERATFAWPANHEFRHSATWPMDHAFDLSRSWPAHHEYDDSGARNDRKER